MSQDCTGSRVDTRTLQIRDHTDLIGEISSLGFWHGWTNARFELSVARDICSPCRVCWSTGSPWRTRCLGIRPCKRRSRRSCRNPVFTWQTRNEPASPECSIPVDLPAAARALPDSLRHGCRHNRRKGHQAPTVRSGSFATGSCLFRVNARLGREYAGATCGSLTSLRHRQDTPNISDDRRRRNPFSRHAHDGSMGCSCPGRFPSCAGLHWPGDHLCQGPQLVRTCWRLRQGWLCARRHPRRHASTTVAVSAGF